MTDQPALAHWVCAEIARNSSRDCLEKPEQLLGNCPIILRAQLLCISSDQIIRSADRLLTLGLFQSKP